MLTALEHSVLLTQAHLALIKYEGMAGALLNWDWGGRICFAKWKNKTFCGDKKKIGSLHFINTYKYSSQVLTFSWFISIPCGRQRYPPSVLAFPLTDVKQIQWEIERDKWLHNRDVKSIIKQKKQFRRRGLKNKYKGKKSKRWTRHFDVDVFVIIILK